MEHGVPAQAQRTWDQLKVRAAARARDVADTLLVRLRHGVDHAGKQVGDLELVLLGGGVLLYALGRRRAKVES